MNGDLKKAALAVANLVAKYGENSITENPNRFYGIVCDTLLEAKYNTAKVLIKKGLDSGAYESVMSKKGDRFAEAKRATMSLVNTEFMAEAHAREIVAMLLISLDSSKANIEKVEKWVDELSVKTQPTANVSSTASTQSTLSGSTVSDPLIKRAFGFLEDGKWMNAEQYAEKVLDKTPESSVAYLIKLMAKLKIKNEAQLEKYATPLFVDENYFKKAMQFANPAEKIQLTSYMQKNVYAHASHIEHIAKTESEYKEAARLYNIDPSYKDCGRKYEKCLEDAKNARNEELYQKALAAPLEEQEEAFALVAGYKDADYKKVQAANALIKKRESERIAREQEEERKRIENQRYMELRRKERSAKIWTTVISLAVSIGILLLDMWLTDSLKDSTGAFRWLWLPLIGALTCGAASTMLCLLLTNGKIAAWPLLVFAIPGALWALVRGIVVFLAYFGAAQGFWAWVWALLTCLIVLLLNLAGWAIGSIVCFSFFAEEC